MITKFQEYIKEGVKDLMTPKPNEEVRQAYIKLVNSLEGCTVDKYPDELQTDFKQIASLFGVPIGSLYLIEEEGRNYDYHTFDDFFEDIVDINNKVIVDGVKNEDGESSGDWICYPKQKLAKWSDNDFNNPGAWIFPKNFFSDKLYESIRDMMTPKPKEEIINSLKGDKTVVFKPTSTYDETNMWITRIGTLDASYSDLFELFDEPNGEVDDYKSSTAWELKDNKGRFVRISDYKSTILYDNDPELPTVEEFRKLPSYGWHVQGSRKDPDSLINDLTTYIILHII